MGDVVALRRCRRCGRSADTHRKVEYGGREIFDFWACGKCVAEVEAALAKERLVFEALLQLGIPRRVANEMMIAKRKAEQEP